VSAEPVEDELGIIDAEPERAPEAVAEPEPEHAPEAVAEPEPEELAPAAEAEPESEATERATEAAEPARHTVGHAIARQLAAAGTRLAFTVPGESFLEILDGFRAAGVRVVPGPRRGTPLRLRRLRR